MNELIAISRTYRRINIYETVNGFEIIGADDRVYPFKTWAEACAFVDAWYAMQFLIGDVPIK
jgi:hypothetical protein